jgi:tRNA(fMet)-specific endonuclease VapC
MSDYLLDTCTVSDFFSDTGSTRRRLRVALPSEVAISSVTVMEVLYGFALKPAIAKKLLPSFESLCATISVLPFDGHAATIAANLRAALKIKGTPIGSFDLLIAATAIANNRTLVTSNVSEFERIKQLKVENWRQL